MFLPPSVCLFVCLSVCLSTRLLKQLRMDFDVCVWVAQGTVDYILVVIQITFQI